MTIEVKRFCARIAIFATGGAKATLDFLNRVAICASSGKRVRWKTNVNGLIFTHCITIESIRIKRMATKQDTEQLLERQTVKPPPLYQVALLNDDYTPMEFVVAIIQEYFNKDRETATQIMLSVHRHGKGVCGVFSKDIACTKVEFVLTHARKAGHPLQCVMEEV
jgi:ATP-dependent Clp protease adaptor protein ClpS